MQSLSKLLSLVLLCLLVAEVSNSADELPTITIGHMDLAEDIRYTDWNVHPVDIRSATAIIDHRAYAGAQLAAEELKQFQRIAKVNFALQRNTVNTYSEMIQEITDMRKSGIQFFLIDAPETVVSEVARQTVDQGIYLFNTTSIGDKIRNEDCQKHLFHFSASRSMRTDAIAQYLVSQKWTRILVLQGPLPEDLETTQAFERSSKHFGLEIEEIRNFVLGNDPRSRDINDLDFLTGKARYDAVFVADADGEFSLGLPYATQRPAAVAGASGIIARVWHWSYLRHGAPQVHGRFERMHGRRMGESDWAAWVALKTLGMAVARSKSKDPEKIAAYLRSGELRIDGSKGPGMSIRPWNNQLRQPILLTTENWTISRAPIEGFKHRTNNLDTIGFGERDTACQF